MVTEYIEYNPEKKEANNTANNPVNEIKDSEIITDALTVMQNAQLENNIESENNEIMQNNNGPVIDPNILLDIDKTEIQNESNLEPEDIINHDSLIEEINRELEPDDNITEEINKTEDNKPGCYKEATWITTIKELFKEYDVGFCSEHFEEEPLIINPVD